MISKHSAHSTSLPVGFRTWLWRYTCLLLLISMLWHRQAIFESKGDKLSHSPSDCRIRTQGHRHLFASRLNTCWKTDWAIEDQAKNLNSIARLYDQQAFSPLDLTASWLSHMALAIYMFVVVNFDALAQASHIRIERRQVVFLCWMQDSNPRSQTRIRQLTECLLTNRLSCRGSSKKPWTRQPVSMISKRSAHSTSLPVGFRTWFWRCSCLLLLISMLWHRQAIFESKGDKVSSSAECKIRTQGLRHLFASRLNACWQTDWAIEAISWSSNGFIVQRLQVCYDTQVVIRGFWYRRSPPRQLNVAYVYM